MNRIDSKFRKLKQEKKSAFIPYICGGDPNLDITRKLVLTLDKAGADIIELGVPFSDPIADGPTIQKASERALENGITLSQLLQLVADLRTETDVPIVLMGYYNPIFVMGLEEFFTKARSVGVDGIIIPDLPIEESDPIQRFSAQYDIKVVFLVAPTSTVERMTKIAKSGGGFIYCVSVTGVTGTRREISTDVVPMITELRRHTKTPICVGFGISNSEQARSIADIADGVVVGSAIIDQIESNIGNETNIIESVGNFATELIQGIKR